MKEFALKHPFITFLLVDAVVCNVLNFGNNILRLIDRKKNEETAEEETPDEPANDIQ